MANSNKRFLSLEKPGLLKEWDFEKNASICFPDEITSGSSKKVWWICSNGHSWMATICNRTNGAGCPYCSGKYPEKGINDFATTNPELLEEWDYKKNELICSPDDISAGSHKAVYWKCKNGHSWHSEIRARVKGANCPYCTGKRRLSGFNDFATRYPELLTEWDYDKNDTEPSELSPGSHQKVWWICSDCGEKWQAEVANRVAGSGCPKCGYLKRSKSNRTASYQKSLAFLHPELLSEWDFSQNTTLDPNSIHPKSSQIAWWICPECKQKYQAPIANRVGGTACPVCAGKVVVSGINDLETWCRNNNRQDILDEWDYEKNNIFPTETTPFSNKAMWFICKQGHSSKSRLANRTKNYTGCPVCEKARGTSFQEQACFYYLEKMFSNVSNSHHESWLGGLELDIYLQDIKTAVEYDGITWHKDNEKDLYKNDLCRKNGVRLIRLRENGLSSLPSCECLIIDNHGSQALNEAIKSLLVLLGDEGDDIDINVDRDASKIIERYDFKIKENSIARRYPELIKEWNYEKNGNVNPEHVSYGSARKHWWKCSKCGNEYLMAVNNRTDQKQGCPICSKSKRRDTYVTHRIEVIGSLASNMPEILDEWDYEKNTLSPDSYLVGSKQKVWWKCPVCGGSWRAEIQNRTKEKGTGCPYCSGRRALKGFNDLATKFPFLLGEWVAEKNNGLQPSDFTGGSSQKILWTCSTCGNEWIATIGDRTSGRGCPKCARKRAAKMQSKRVTCIETGVVFESVKEASGWAGIRDSALVNCLKGKTNMAGRYHWKYTE